MTVQFPPSTDTADELPSFVSEQELRVARGAAQNMARKRDELAAENARLRRELEGSARQQRVMEETSGAESASRRTALLRDALAKKDQEILSLKGQILARERAAQEARDLAERARRERVEVEERLRAAASIDAERAQLARALDSARRDAEQTAAALVHADSVVAEWRAAMETCMRERDEARRQVGEITRVAQELRVAWDAAQHERQRLAEAHAQELASLQAQQGGALDQQRARYERLLAEAAQRFETARESHAVAIRYAEDAHAQTVAAERAARIRAEESLAAAGARRAEVERKAAEVERKVADIERVHEGYARELDALRAANARDMEEMQRAHGLDVAAAREDARQDGRAEVLVELDALRAVADERDALQRRVDDLTAEIESARDQRAQLEALCSAAEESVREARCANDDLLEQAREAYASALDDLRAGHEREIDDLRAAHGRDLAEREGTIAALREDDGSAGARVAELERDLEATREALGNYAAECAERLDAAERLAVEARGFRERLTRRLSESVEQLRVTTERAQTDAETFTTEIRRLTSLVGRLTARVVVQGAQHKAIARGARAPEGDDLDDAISRIADDLPCAVASALWDARDELLRRALASSAPC